MRTGYGDIQIEEQENNNLIIWGRCYRAGQPIYSRATGKVYLVTRSWDGTTNAEHSILQPAEHMLHSITEIGIQHVIKMHTSVVVFISKEYAPTMNVEEYSSYALFVRPGAMSMEVMLDAEQQTRLYATERVLLETLHALFPNGYVRVESRHELAVLCEERL